MGLSQIFVFPPRMNSRPVALRQLPDDAYLYPVGCATSSTRFILVPPPPAIMAEATEVTLSVVGWPTAPHLKSIAGTLYSSAWAGRSRPSLPSEAEIEALPVQLSARLIRLLEAVENVRLEALRGPHAKHLDGKLWELRVRPREESPEGST